MKKKGLFAAILLILGSAAFLFNALLSPKSATDNWIFIDISSGSSLIGVSNILVEEDLVSPSGGKAFLIAGVITGRGKRLQEGRYKLSSKMTPWAIMQKLEKGELYTEWITVPEGFTLRQIGSLLEEKGIGTEQRFINLTDGSTDSFEPPFPVEGNSLEGYLFPDTYKVNGNGQRELVSKMLTRFDEVVWEGLMKKKTRFNGFSLHELLTLASLIEGEARIDEERPIIAGVLKNRLNKGMKLECDATVQYALGKRKDRLVYKDLEVDSPYNTYMHVGLPPGPINNPGKASIEAAMRPASTQHYFYVAKPDGSHIFSRTFTEHKAAIARIRSNR